MSEIALSFNGTACDETVAWGTGSTQAVRTVADFDFVGVSYTPVTTPFPLRGGEVKDGDSVPGPYDGTFWIRSECSGPATIERAMLDEWRLLAGRYSPALGTVTLKVSRKDEAGNSVASVLRVEVLRAPCASYAGKSTGPRSPGLRPAGWLVYPVAFRTLAPFWQAESNSGSQLYAVAGGVPATYTITNPGPVACGVKMLFGAASVGGTVTKVKVTNNTTGKTFEVATTGTTFTSGDYVDWYHTKLNDDPTWSSAGTFTVTPANADLLLIPGNNSVKLEVTAGAGAIDVTLSWKRLDFTF